MAISAQAKVVSQTIEYKQGSALLEGYVSYDDSISGPRPAVIVVHNWMGLSEGTKKKTDELAQLGYVAFAADIYGKGIRAKDASEAGKLAGTYKGDRKLLRARALAALEALKTVKQADSKNVAAIGFCFGGTTVLEMALSGAALKGVVSFHGGLDGLTDVTKNKAKILVLHGAIDPYVPATDVAAFTDLMNKAKTDYQFISYANSVHAFSEPEAGNDNSKGAAYNEKAALRSFEAMKIFLKEAFL